MKITSHTKIQHEFTISISHEELEKLLILMDNAVLPRDGDTYESASYVYEIPAGAREVWIDLYNTLSEECGER